MKILVTGSTGLVGRALVGELKQAGHTVCRLVRPGTDGEALRGSEGFDVRWSPATGELGAAAVGADAVVNLAGASIVDGRWTRERKNVLRSSRGGYDARTGERAGEDGGAATGVGVCVCDWILWRPGR